MDVMHSALCSVTCLSKLFKGIWSTKPFGTNISGIAWPQRCLWWSFTLYSKLHCCLGCPGAVHNLVGAMSHGWSKDGILSSLYMTTNDVIVAGKCNFEGRFVQPVSNVTLCTVLSIPMHMFPIWSFLETVIQHSAWSHYHGNWASL